MVKRVISICLFIVLVYSTQARETVFKEQRIGFGYYPSFKGSQNFWLNYSFNKRDQKLIYSIRGMYNFRSESTQEVTNYAIGPCVSARMFALFKNKLDFRATLFGGYVNFTYKKVNYPGNLYDTQYNGAVLMPGINIQTELTDRIGLRYGGNAGVYYAKTEEPVFYKKNGNLSYDVFFNKGIYWLVLVDFSITIKITKNYLPHQR